MCNKKITHFKRALLDLAIQQGKVAYYGEVSHLGEVHYFIPGGAAICV
jgi:hypothetical protein